MERSFRDELVSGSQPGLPDGFFDRFVFNLHPVDRSAPSILFGLGRYPARDTVDGFAILSTETEQRNVRFSTELSAIDGSSAGPLSWEVVEPLKAWHVLLAPNPAGMAFDLIWRARTPAWFGDVAVTNSGGSPSSFDHLTRKRGPVGQAAAARAVFARAGGRAGCGPAGPRVSWPAVRQGGSPRSVEEGQLVAGPGFRRPPGRGRAAGAPPAGGGRAGRRCCRAAG